MSVSDFFSSIADKAQNAISQTPLAGHIPGTTPAADPSANHPASQGGRRSFALETLQHQIRSIGQQYTTTSPLQRIITLEKGVALDYDALARDGKGQSKELYTWGKDEGPDLTDVTDRLAYLNFVHGSLSATLAVKLDGARSPLKALRDAEVAIAPKRNIRAGLRNQIARIEHNPEKGADRRLGELREQLARAEKTDERLEKELELLKRKAIRESEQGKWAALREYGEKIVLLSQAAKPIVDALPTLPPTTANPYTGAEATASARASLQQALDGYTPGQVHLELQAGGDLARSDTRSFGESHASELSSLASHSGGQESHPGLSLTPPIPEPGEKEGHGDPSLPAPDVGGVVERASEDVSDRAPPKTESAEEEKQRLEREERARVVAASSALSESAEEEKKRLERERQVGGGGGGHGDKEGEALPAYESFEE